MIKNRPSRIQQARELLRKYGLGEYTVIRRCKTPSQKGGAYENLKCKQLSEWAIGRNKPQVYCRTSGSGGRATRMGDTRSTEAGDVMSNSPLGDFLTTIFLIELKDRVDADVLDFLTGCKGETPASWWDKLTVQAREAGREPLLIFHKHGTRSDFVVVNYTFMTQIENHVGGYPHGTLEVGDLCMVLRLDQLLAWLKPWDLAFCFLGDETGRNVENNYGKKGERNEGRAKT